MTKRSNYKVSILIPCYNAEKFISKTLETVFNQSFKDYELICLDDGSTDNTLKVLKEYEKKHDNMKVYHKKNEGGKNTTKYGCQFLNCEYCCVIDNDDYLDKDYLKYLYDAITKNNADMAVCAFQREEFETRKVYSIEMKKGNYVIELNNDYGSLLEINTAMWNKMFKTEILKELMNFDLNSIGFGDMTLMSYLYSKINKVCFVDKVLYYYQVRANSNISTMKSDVISSIYDNLIRVKQYYKNNKKEMCEIIDAYAFLHLGISLIYRIYKSKDEKFNDIYKNNIKVLNDNFETWKNNKYLSFTYVLKNKGKNLKIYICKLFYKIHIFSFFIKVYDFIITKFNFDIKW